MIAIVGTTFAALCLTLAAGLLWIAGSDRRWARREEQRRQRLIDRALGRAER